MCYSKILNMSYLYAKTTQIFFNHGVQGSRGKNIIWYYCLCNLFMDSSSGTKLVLGIMFSSISKSNVDVHGKVS